MKVLINAVSAKLGGAATYIHNLARTLPTLAAQQDRFVFVVPSRPPWEEESPQIRVVASDAATGSYARRWWWDQVELRRIVAEERPDVLFSSANFAMLNCPCPQALLVRNPIYFSQHYIKQVLPNRGAWLRAETAIRRWLVTQSVAAADCLITPSRAMLDDLLRYARVNRQSSVVNPYGVPSERVLRGSMERGVHRPARFLWVSHYADHKNVSTLLEAAKQLRDENQLAFELILTLDASTHTGQHTAMPESERALLHSLAGNVRAAGVQSYEATWQLYSGADIFVFPSLTESFGHPLVEAMASQLPIVASDIPIHREICGDAAIYFSPLDARALASALTRAAQDAELRQRLMNRAREQVKSFLWEDHVVRLLATLRDTAAVRRARAA